MTKDGRELPMAPADCTLDPVRLGEQLERYRRLGAAAGQIEPGDQELVVWFEDRVDLELLAATVATERECCSFFTLDYDASRRRLSIAVDDPTRRAALAALLGALSGETPSLPRRRSR